MLSILQNKNFRILWSGQVLSQLADRMLVGILLLDVHLLTNNNLALSLPMLSFGLSAVIFGTIAGVYVDRWSKKSILLWSNILRGSLILSFTIFPIFRESLILIFLMSFLIFTIAQYFLPAESACIPTIISKADLVGANSFFMGTWMGATVAGFGLISLLSVLGFEVPYIYGAASVLYFLAGIIMCFLQITENPSSKSHTISSTIKDLFQGFSYVIKRRTIRYSLLKVFIATCVLAVLSELAIDFVKTTLNQSSEKFGFYVAFAGVGMGVSILTLNLLKNIPLDKLPWIGFTISGLMLIMMNTSSNLYIALAYIFLLGFGNGYITIPIQTILQANVPRQMRGRVFGIQNVLISGAFTIPVIIAGYFADLYSVSYVFITLGVLKFISIISIEIRLLLVPLSKSKYTK